MLYVSNRNHGCRIKEITLKGCRSLLLENNVLHLLVLLDKGADIAEFVYKPCDMDFLWRSPAGLDALEQRLSGAQCYVGGWFECFPNAGGGCNHQGREIPQYGDVKDLPWDYDVLCDTAEKLSVRLFVQSNVLPLRLERVLTLEQGRPALGIEESVQNLSKEQIPFTWGHHPNIGQPFLEEHCVIDLPGGDMAVFETVNGSLAEKRIGQWPFLAEGDGQRDLRIIPAPEENLHDLLYLKDLPDNWAAVRNGRTGLGLRLEWDPAVFNAMLLWRAFDSASWSTLFGHRYILCFLFKSSHRSTVSDAMEAGTALRIPPGGRIDTWLKATVITNEPDSNE